MGDYICDVACSVTLNDVKMLNFLYFNVVLNSLD